MNRRKCVSQAAWRPSVLEMIESHVQPGITTEELDRICHDYIVKEQDAIPAPLNYHGFPKSICTSVNHVICHGIPGPKKLKSGDAAQYRHHRHQGRLSRRHLENVFVGKPTIQARALSRVAREAHDGRHPSWCGPAPRLGDIGHAIQSSPRSRLLRGARILRPRHRQGIPRRPAGAALRQAGTGLVLEGHDLHHRAHGQCRQAPHPPAADGWTVVTKDHSLSAQWEHTLLVTADGVEVLTRRQEEDDL
jgi:methionyl aminopeptidase